jgi:hypothetical protein
MVVLEEDWLSNHEQIPEQHSWLKIGLSTSIFFGKCRIG